MPKENEIVASCPYCGKRNVYYISSDNGIFKVICSRCDGSFYIALYESQVIATEDSLEDLEKAVDLYKKLSQENGFFQGNGGGMSMEL